MCIITVPMSASPRSAASGSMGEWGIFKYFFSCIRVVAHCLFVSAQVTISAHYKQRVNIMSHQQPLLYYAKLLGSGHIWICVRKRKHRSRKCDHYNCALQLVSLRELLDSNPCRLRVVALINGLFDPIFITFLSPFLFGSLQRKAIRVDQKFPISLLSLAAS